MGGLRKGWMGGLRNDLVRDEFVRSSCPRWSVSGCSFLVGNRPQDPSGSTSLTLVRFVTLVRFDVFDTSEALGFRV